MYGVVICSKCRRAKGVRVGQKTTRCQCGHSIKLSEVKLVFKAEDARKVAQAVGLENARLKGGLAEYERSSTPPRKRRGALGRAATAAEKAGTRDTKVKAVAAELSRELGAFSSRDFAVVLISLAIPDPQKRLEELVKGNFVYEPAPDRYRIV